MGEETPPFFIMILALKIIGTLVIGYILLNRLFHYMDK